MAGNNNILGGGGLHHVAIRTTDLDTSVKFYTEVLGMKTVVAFKPDERSFVQLDAGDGLLEFEREFGAALAQLGSQGLGGLLALDHVGEGDPIVLEPLGDGPDAGLGPVSRRWGSRGALHDGGFKPGTDVLQDRSVQVMF